MLNIFQLIVFVLLLAVDICFAQAPPDSLNPPKPASQSSEKHSAVSMTFLKEKTQHSPDSVFFNILKITNTNAKQIDGVVSITVPIGWKLISKEQTIVSVSPGNTEYIPVRVSLSRKAVGGVSYLINATLNSDRSLQPDKNQTSVSKACYITIPKKSSWDVYPFQTTVYFDRFADLAPMQIMLKNKGNGFEIVKLEFTVGSSLEMQGAMGRKFFTSVELKPNRDTVLSFLVKHIPADDASFYNKDFKSMTVRVLAAVDSTIKKTSVNFKYLESVYYNILAEKISPLILDVQLQNLLSNFQPRLMIGATGNIFFKNDHMLDYHLRFNSLQFTGYSDAADFAEQALWQRCRMYAKYDATKWFVMGGDIAVPSSFVGMGGRGIGGGYQINNTNSIKGAVTAHVASPVYSAGIEHKIDIKKMAIATTVFGTANNVSKINNYGASVTAMYPFLAGHRLSLTLAGTQTQHLYDNTTFTDGGGNFITTNDPGATFNGFGVRAQYSMRVKKARATLNSTFTSKHFSERYNGRLFINGNGQYYLNKKISILGGGYFSLLDPVYYNQGLLNLRNKFMVGRYYAEASRRMSSRVSLNAGPVFEHAYHESMKIDQLGDTIKTFFSSYSPKLSLRMNYKSRSNSLINPHLLAGYTHIVVAKDSTIGPPSDAFKNNFFNASAGINIVQENWGVNIFYYFGPSDFLSQSDYYYYHSYKKSLRAMPYFQKYFFNKTMLFSSRNTYYYEAHNNSERIVLNGSLSFFLGRDWTFNVDNNLYMFSRVTNEGTKTYSRSYYLNLGVHKIFDIPQPGIKYHDLKIVCYKDMNGNQIMDNNEQGISDVVLSIDRTVVRDSTGKSIKQKGLFTPIEMVTDNFGQVMYYHIPTGDFNVNITPLRNLSDLYNVNGKKQSFSVSRDTTYYIPFVQSFRVFGKIILNRDEFSSQGSVSVANVRVTATDSVGNSFSVLTSADGSYTLYAPRAGEYKVSVNNVFGDLFTLQESEYVVSFDGAKEFNVDFKFNEKKRKVNINGASTTVDTLLGRKPGLFAVAGKDTIKNVTMVTDTMGSSTAAGQKGQTYTIPVGPGITYRIQLIATSTRIPKSQYATRFKGVAVTEYAEGTTYKYTAGDLKTVEEAKTLKDILRNQGYKDAFLVPFYKGSRVKY